MNAQAFQRLPFGARAVLLTILLLPLSAWLSSSEGPGDFTLPFGLIVLAGTACFLVFRMLWPRPEGGSALEGAFGFLVALLLIMNPAPPEWDGAGYFAQARSLGFDWDLDLANEVALFPSLQYLSYEHPKTGRLAVPFPIGPALLWLPGTVPGGFYGQHDGTEPQYTVAVAGTALLAAWIGLLAVVGAAQRAARLLGGEDAPADAAGTAAVLVCMASPLPYYAGHAVAYSHAYQFAALAVVAWLGVRAAERWVSGEPPAAVRAGVAWGLALGVAFLMRWQSALLLAGLAPVGVWMLMACRERVHVSWVAKALAAAAVAGMVVVLPQLLAWRSMTGSMLEPPRLGADFFRWSSPQVAGVLLSAWNGLFFVHPGLLLAGALGVWGIALHGRDAGATREKNGQDARSTGAAAVLAGIAIWMAGETLLASVTADWHGGGAFGQRRLVGFVPVLAVGAGMWAALPGRKLIGRGFVSGVLATLGIWSVLLAGATAERHVPVSPADPTNYAHLEAVEPYGPWDWGAAVAAQAGGVAAFLIEPKAQPPGAE